MYRGFARGHVSLRVRIFSAEKILKLRRRRAANPLKDTCPARLFTRDSLDFLFLMGYTRTSNMRMPILQARFAVRKSNPGLGHGLFATAMIKKGDFILEYIGKRIPAPQADASSSRYLFEINRDWTVDGSSRSNIARYINHSCSPNCEGELRDGRILIYAARDIVKGEEFTIDYGDEYFDEFIKPIGCKCVQCAARALSYQADELTRGSAQRI